MVCQTCGADNPEDANYCSVCGAHLAHVDDEATTVLQTMDTDLDTVPHAVDAEAAGAALDTAGESAMLVVSRGPNAGSKYVVTDRATIGRHPDSDFFLDDVTVSRRHAEVRHEGSGFTLKDNGSLNGTYVNGDRVEQCALQHGDEIRIGKYVIVFLRG
ncbi:MAG: FHA domain-containing protein [Acidimicrobiia bacterium]